MMLTMRPTVYVFTDPLVESELQTAIEKVQDPSIGIHKIIFAPHRTKKERSNNSLNETLLFHLFDVMRQNSERSHTVGVDATFGERSEEEQRFLQCFCTQWIAHPDMSFQYNCHFVGVLDKYPSSQLERNIAAAITKGGKWTKGVCFYSGKGRSAHNRDLLLAVFEAALDGRVENFYTDYFCSFCTDKLSTNKSLRHLSTPCRTEHDLRNLTERLVQNNTLRTLHLTTFPQTLVTKKCMAKLIRYNTAIESIFAPIIPVRVTEEDDELLRSLEHNTTLTSIKDFCGGLDIRSGMKPALVDWKQRARSLLYPNKVSKRVQNVASPSRKEGIPFELYPSILKDFGNKPMLAYKLLQQEDMIHLLTSRNNKALRI